MWPLLWNSILENVDMKKVSERRLVYFRLWLEESTSSLVEFSVEKCIPFLDPFIFSIYHSQIPGQKNFFRQVSFCLQIWGDTGRQQSCECQATYHSMCTSKKQRVRKTSVRSLSLFIHKEIFAYWLGPSLGHVLIY